MTRYVLKEPVELMDKHWLKLGDEHNTVFIRADRFEVIEESPGVDLSDKSMHTIGQMIASRDATIQKLRKEIADAKAGGQPASELRDAVMPTLEKIKEYLRDSDQPVARRMLDSLIGHLKTIPTLEPPSEKVAEKELKPYKPLDHGPRGLVDG